MSVVIENVTARVVTPTTDEPTPKARAVSTSASPPQAPDLTRQIERTLRLRTERAARIHAD